MASAVSVAENPNSQAQATAQSELTEMKDRATQEIQDYTDEVTGVYNRGEM